MLLFAVSGAVALAVVAAMVALAQAEARTERRTLFAVGASPAVLRGTAAATAGLLALLGGVLAVQAGLLPLAAVYATTPAVVPLVVPWADWPWGLSSSQRCGGGQRSVDQDHLWVPRAERATVLDILKVVDTLDGGPAWRRWSPACLGWRSSRGGRLRRR
jgi:hypothetical protein